MINLPGFKSYDSAGLPIYDWERQELANRAIDLANKEPLPYEATLCYTGDCFILVLKDKATGRLEVRDLVPKTVCFPDP